MLNLENKSDLTFSDFLGDLDSFGTDEWITVYSEYQIEGEHYTFYSALADKGKTNSLLSDFSWDFHIGNGMPTAVKHTEDGKNILEYYKCSDNGIEPIAIRRDFYKVKEEYWEILEEFRHYFNLFENRKNNKFIYIYDNGEEEDAIFITKNEIKIKLWLIQEFIYVKDMAFVMFFTLDRSLEQKLEEMGIEATRHEGKEKNYCYILGISNIETGGNENFNSHSHLIGKKIILPSKNFKTRQAITDDSEYVDFIVAIDDDGNEVLSTCNEYELGSNGLPEFLTPVAFSKNVLSKYYNESSKYTVGDGYVRCGDLWHMPIDNDITDYITVYLGDLGRLNYLEQIHWRGFNLKTKGKISQRAFKKNHLALPTEPESTIFIFKKKFEDFQFKWEKQFSWKFFLPLKEGDQYLYKTLKIPITNEQKEFDELILALVKLTIDSLNGKKLLENINSEDIKSNNNYKGIDKLKLFLEFEGINYDPGIDFLRKLQALRSSSSVHRKGKSYNELKEYFKIDEEDFSIIFSSILDAFTEILNQLDKYILN